MPSTICRRVDLQLGANVPYTLKKKQLVPPKILRPCVQIYRYLIPCFLLTIVNIITEIGDMNRLESINKV